MKKRKRNGGKKEDQKALKKGNGVSEDFCLTELPADVLREICFRLPINSIMKLKSLSKELYRILSRPDFTVKYTKNSPYVALLFYREEYTESYRYPVLSMREISDNCEFIRTPINPKIPGWSETNSRLFFGGTCNGLLCFLLQQSGSEIVYISNPIIGECIALPEHQLKSRDKYSSWEYGFGFCQSTNNYKLLRILSEESLYEGEGEILTIGVDDKWRPLAYPKILINFGFSSLVALNGAFHWLVEDGGLTWISTFDLREERLGVIPNPRRMMLILGRMWLKSFNNQLCIVDSSIRYVMVIWKMNEYGVQKSWTKDIILRMSVPKEVTFTALVPLTILQNGDIIFTAGAEYVISYNPSTRRCIKIRVSNYERIAFAPCFTSLKDMIMGGHRSDVNV